MDLLTKSGKVYLRPLKPGKKWKAAWLSLFPPSSSGVGRLEIKDMGGDDHNPGVRKHHQVYGDRKPKVVRLSELISVLRLPPNAEACPMDNMSAFCVETQDRTMVFAALKDDCVDWVDRLCQSSFKTGSVSSSAQVHMEENQIYASADELPRFQVLIQKTDAGTRCGLQGSFWLQVEQEALLLREPQKNNIVLKWPYELLRRFGIDKMTITIEAGRRCDSGPGTFCFETNQAEKIFSLIQSSIKQKTWSTTTSNQIQEGEKVIMASKRDHSPIPKIFDMTNMFASLDNKLRRSPVFTDRSLTQEDSVGRSESTPAPITLMPLPLVPTHDRSRIGDGQSDGIYANPECCIPTIRTLQPTKALYIEPSNVLPLNPPSLKVSDTLSLTSAAPDPTLKTDVQDSVYSEVLDKISPEQKQQSDLLLKTFSKTTASANDEPIYSEPIRETDKPSQKPETKPDPFAHLYAKVCKPPSSCGPSSTGSATSSTSSAPSSVTSRMTTAKAEPLDDVIYENLGII
ncbi:docking protein 3 [Xenentodon cancila]